MSHQVNFNIPIQNSDNNIYTKYEVNMEEYQIKIESLISLLSELFTTENFEVDFQLAYSKCHEICLNRMAKELYNEVVKLFNKIVSSYKEQLLNISFPDNLSLFFEKITNNFEFYSKKISQISDMLSYMDRIRERSHLNDLSISNKGIQIFYQNIIFEDIIKMRIIQSLSKEFNEIKNGKKDKIELFKKFFNMIIEKQYGTIFYSIDLIPTITQDTKSFFEKMNLDFTSKITNQDKKEIYLSIKNYLTKINEELIIHDEYFKLLEERNSLIENIYDLCIVHQFELFFKKGAKKAFKLNEIEFFKIIYNIIFCYNVKNIDDIKNQFYTHFNEMISKQLKKLSNTFVTIKPNKQVEYFNFYQYIEEIFNLKKKFTNFLINAINNDPKVEHIIKSNFEKLINNEYSSEFVNSFIKLIHEEIKLCQKIKNNKRIIEFSGKFDIIFKLINNKDLFEIVYRNNLCKRLIRNSSMMKETELIFYEKMKEESGTNYVKDIKTMISDIMNSLEINYNYKVDTKNNNIECYFKILSKDSWPIKINTKTLKEENNNNSTDNKKDDDKNNLNVKIDIILPLPLYKCLSDFNIYYNSHFKNRNLIYIPELSWAELSAKINNKEYTFIVSVSQLVILMLFNKNKKISIETICNETKIKQNQIQSYYYYLVKTKLLILNNNILELNTNFKSNENKINLNYKNTKNDEKEKKEEKELSHFVIEDRKYQIDASIIHELKFNKKLSFEELKKNIIKNLSGYFVPEIQLIKARLENLLDRNLIKRDENNSEIYIYIA